MTVELITAATPESTRPWGVSIPQPVPLRRPHERGRVQRFLSRDSVHLFAFRPDEADAQGNRPILGMLSLVTFEIPTGVRAWIERRRRRGCPRPRCRVRPRGCGPRAREEMFGARTVDLTSRPSREAANRLYQRAGSSCARPTCTA